MGVDTDSPNSLTAFSFRVTLELVKRHLAIYATTAALASLLLGVPCLSLMAAMQGPSHECCPGESGESHTSPVGCQSYCAAAATETMSAKALAKAAVAVLGDAPSAERLDVSPAPSPVPISSRAGPPSALFLLNSAVLI